jgi:hypothetical protein
MPPAWEWFARPARIVTGLPARAWCREIAARFGIDMAHALMKDINAMIETELNWRQ